MASAYECDGCGKLISKRYVAHANVPFKDGTLHIKARLQTVKEDSFDNEYLCDDDFDTEYLCDYDLCEECISRLIRNLNIREE